MSAALALCACGGRASSEPEPAVAVEKICGQPGETYIRSLDDLAGCTTFRGAIHISDTGHVRLPFPATLRVIEGRLSFFRNSALIDLRGLENLTSIGGLMLSQHEKLGDISALAGVRVQGEVFVGGNDALTSLRGLESIEEASLLFIASNTALTSLDGLAGLRRVTGDLTIRSNAVLPQSAAEAFGAKVVVDGKLEIAGNKAR